MDHTEQTGTASRAQAPEQAPRPGQERAGRTASVTGGQPHQPFDHPHARPTVGGHPHGRPSSWVLTGAVVVAFLAGGAALILHLWWLFWVCVGVVVLSVPAGKAIGIMDDTVMWGGTETEQHDPDGGPRRLEP